MMHNSLKCCVLRDTDRQHSDIAQSDDGGAREHVDEKRRTARHNRCDVDKWLQTRAFGARENRNFLSPNSAGGILRVRILRPLARRARDTGEIGLEREDGVPQLAGARSIAISPCFVRERSGFYGHWEG
jgi:hypothetical protein